MSRIGKKPIEIPAGVTVNIDGTIVKVKGPKGELVNTFNNNLDIKMENNEIVVQRPNEEKKIRALHGLTRTLIYNMIIGVTEGYQKELEIVGTGYRAQKAGKKLSLTLGLSHPLDLEDPEGIEVEVPAPNKMIVKGIDKQKVGEYAAYIRGFRQPEPYKGKGIKYVDEVIRRKVGKTGK